MGRGVLSEMIDDCCCSIGLKPDFSCVVTVDKRFDGVCCCVRITGIGNDCCPSAFPFGIGSEYDCCCCLAEFNGDEGA